MYPNYERIAKEIHVRVAELPLIEELRSLRYVIMWPRPGPEVIKLFVLNSTEHEFSTAHKN